MKIDKRTLKQIIDAIAQMTDESSITRFLTDSRYKGMLEDSQIVKKLIKANPLVRETLFNLRI